MIFFVGCGDASPSAAFTRVQDTEIAGADDARVLEYAADYGYIVLTHDVNTMRGLFYQRVQVTYQFPVFFSSINKRQLVVLLMLLN